MFGLRKKLRELTERIERLEAAQAQGTGTVSAGANEKKPFEAIKRDWMLYDDERKGAAT